MEKYAVIYLGKKTEVTGNYYIEDSKPDFCCNTVSADNKSITHKLDSVDFTVLESLVLIERLKGIILNK